MFFFLNVHNSLHTTHTHTHGEMVDLVNPTKWEKLNGKVDKLKHRQQIQKWYFVWWSLSEINIIFESVISVSVYSLLHIYFLFLIYNIRIRK